MFLIVTDLKVYKVTSLMCTNQQIFSKINFFTNKHTDKLKNIYKIESIITYLLKEKL
jgi:hypothetical protein